MDGTTPQGRVYALARLDSFNEAHRIEFPGHSHRVAGERPLVTGAKVGRGK